MLPHPDPEGFRQGGGLPQPKPQWGFGYAAEGAKALPNHFARKPLSETVLLPVIRFFPRTAFAFDAQKQCVFCFLRLFQAFFTFFIVFFLHADFRCPASGTFFMLE